MRKLMYAAMGYSAVLVLCHYIMPLGMQLWLALGLALAAVLCLVFKGKVRLFAMIFLLAGAIASAWNYAHYALIIKPADSLSGTSACVEARVYDYADINDGYSSVTLIIDAGGIGNTKVLSYCYDADISDLKPGDIIEAELDFRSAAERYNVEDDHYYSNGIFLRANMSEYTFIGHRTASVADLPRELAAFIKEKILALFPDDIAPLMKALLTGDKNELYEQDRQYVSLRLSGLSHIIAVSGMHVSFIISLISLFTGRRRITAFLGIPLVWFFAAMTGLGPSVVRASIMISLLLIAPILRRENDPPTSLSAAALILLLINPQSIGSISFQLSFGAMAGIILVSPRVYKAVTSVYRDRGALTFNILRVINCIFSSSVGALVFTVPLAALHFGYVATYSIISNMLCLWAMSGAFMLSYPVLLLSFIWLPAAKFIALIISILPRFTLFVVDLVARLPWAALYTSNNLAAWWIIFVYAALWIPWFFRGEKTYRPIIPVCCCVITLPIVAWFSSISYETDAGITALDVGQGQSIVLRSDNGATVLVDCGGRGTYSNAGELAAEYILSSGKQKIDLIVLTHLHDDHANGVVRLMNYLDVERIALPENCESTEIGDSILELCYDNNTEVIYISENTNIRIDEISLELFAPIGSEDANENGLIVFGDYGEFEFLITGDAGSGTESQFVSFYPIGEVDVLVAGHHGSRYSTSEIFLDAVKPDIALISVGYNSYGHPTEDVLHRLDSRGIDVYRTDKHGNITVLAGKYNG